MIKMNGSFMKKPIKIANDNYINRKNIVKVRHLHEPFPEKHLWKLVICQAIEDATTKSSKKRDAHKKRIALKWLSECDEDFKTVCEFAGYSYEIVKNNAMKIIANDNNKT
jgi:hypothetical protein